MAGAIWDECAFIRLAVEVLTLLRPEGWLPMKTEDDNKARRRVDRVKHQSATQTTLRVVLFVCPADQERCMRS